MKKQLPPNLIQFPKKTSSGVFWLAEHVYLFRCMFRKAQQCDGYVSFAWRSLVKSWRGGSSFRLKADSAISLLRPPRIESGKEARAVSEMSLQKQAEKKWVSLNFNFRINIMLKWTVHPHKANRHTFPLGSSGIYWCNSFGVSCLVLKTFLVKISVISRM